MEWNMLAKVQLSETRFELKSPCVSASCASAGRPIFGCVAYFTICILSSFKELADLCEEWTWMFAWSHSRKCIHAADSYRELKPSKSHLDQKKTNSDLVKNCFSLLLLSRWWHSNPSWFLFCSQEVKGEILNLSHIPAEEILCITSDTKPFIQTICHSHPPKLIVHQLCFWLYLSKESGDCLLSHPW